MEVAKETTKSTKHQNGTNLDDAALENLISMPKEVVKRVNALKNIQLKMVDIETKFYEELHLLECRYANMYEDLYNQREKIVNGEHEPTEEESKWQLGEDEVEGDLATELKNKANVTETSTTGEEADKAKAKGIPDFWLHSMNSTDILSSAIQEHDEPILKHLRDVRVKLNDTKPYGYTIEFYFNENEYFTNKVLTKTYELTTDKDEKDPFGYDGPVLYKSVGCKIDWVKGKDVTVKLVKKKQKHKSTGTIRVVTKEEKQDSFFNFFESPTPDGIRPSYKSITAPSSFPKPEDSGKAGDEADEEFDEETEELYEADFEIGHFLKEFLIPKAVLYYTGDLVDEGSFDDEDDDYDDEDDDENDDALKDISNIRNEGDEEDEEEEDEEEEEEEEEEEVKAKSKANKKQPAKAKNPKA